MRESIGTTWMFSIIIAFTIIFSAFLVLTLSYSKVYKMKNEITSILEKYEGLTPTSAKIINDYIRNSNYRTRGHCQDESLKSTMSSYSYGLDNLDYNTLEKANDDETYYYCLNYRHTHSGKIVYKVTLFYDFNLPILGKIFKYSIIGETYGIKNTKLPN